MKKSLKSKIINLAQKAKAAGNEIKIIKSSVILLNIITVVLLFFSPSTLMAEEGKSDIEKEFVEAYVKAVNEKDASQMVQLMHPKVRQCLNPSNQDYYDDLFGKAFKYSVPAVYTAKINPLAESDRDFLEKESQAGQKIGLNFPVMATHRLQIDFNLNQNPYSSVGIVRNLAQEGNHYYEVQACPAQEWMEHYRKKMITAQSSPNVYTMTLQYVFENGKPEARIVVEQGGWFKSLEALKKWIQDLAPGTTLEFNRSCRRLSNEPLPLDSEQELNDLKDFCAQHKVNLIVHSAG